MKVADNPNPTANIGFVCFYPLHYYVFKNVYRHLPNAEFIVDPSFMLGGLSSENLEDELYEFFAEKQVRWRAYEPQTTHKENGQDFFSKYALLVSPLYREPMNEPCNRDKKLVRMLYGHAKDPWNFGPWSAYFDLVLSYGPYSQERLNIYGNAQICGNPKFDDWFSEEVVASDHFPNSKKKTALYLPTWGDLNAVSQTIPAFHHLSEKYNLIIKEHHVSHFFTPQESAAFRNNPNIVLVDDRTDILPLLKEADVVISDNSGAIFDAVLADKPLVLIDNLPASMLETHKQTLYYRKEGQVTGVATYRGSLEQRIKQPGQEVGPVLKLSATQAQLTPEQLGAAIEEAARDPEPYQSARRAICREVFAFTDGSSGKRAADAITKLLHSEKPERSLLAESIDAYLQDYFSFRLPSQAGARELQKLGQRYLWLKNRPYTDRLRAVVKEFFSV